MMKLLIVLGGLMLPNLGHATAVSAYGPLTTGAVDTAKLASAAVTTDKIAPLAVDTTKLKADSVTTSKILDAQVDTAKLKANAVDTRKLLLSGTVDTIKVLVVGPSSNGIRACSLAEWNAQNCP